MCPAPSSVRRAHKAAAGGAGSGSGGQAGGAPPPQAGRTPDHPNAKRQRTQGPPQPGPYGPMGHPGGPPPPLYYGGAPPPHYGGPPPGGPYGPPPPHSYGGYHQPPPPHWPGPPHQPPPPGWAHQPPPGGQYSTAGAGGPWGQPPQPQQQSLFGAVAAAGGSTAPADPKAPLWGSAVPSAAVTAAGTAPAPAQPQAAEAAATSDTVLAGQPPLTPAHELAAVHAALPALQANPDPTVLPAFLDKLAETAPAVLADLVIALMVSQPLPTAEEVVARLGGGGAGAPGSTGSTGASAGTAGAGGPGAGPVRTPTPPPVAIPGVSSTAAGSGASQASGDPRARKSATPTPPPPPPPAPASQPAAAGGAAASAAGSKGVADAGKAAPAGGKESSQPPAPLAVGSLSAPSARLAQTILKRALGAGGDASRRLPQGASALPADMPASAFPSAAGVGTAGAAAGAGPGLVRAPAPAPLTSHACGTLRVGAVRRIAAAGGLISSEDGTPGGGVTAAGGGTGSLPPHLSQLHELLLTRLAAAEHGACFSSAAVGPAGTGSTSVAPQVGQVVACDMRYIMCSLFSFLPYFTVPGVSCASHSYLFPHPPHARNPHRWTRSYWLQQSRLWQEAREPPWLCAGCLPCWPRLCVHRRRPQRQQQQVSCGVWVLAFCG